MPVNPKYKARYSPGNFYHIFNRASGSQLLFKNDQNYYYFLSRFHHYLDDFVELKSWCLIPNHYHFLIKIKEVEDLPALNPNTDLHKAITNRFKNFFLSYGIAYKKMHGQKSNVFSQKYKHVRLYTEQDIKNVVMYIHRNPKHHRVGDWQHYKWSSYNEIRYINSKQTKKPFILNLFGGTEAYIKAHFEYVEEGSEPLKGSEPSINPISPSKKTL